MSYTPTTWVNGQPPALNAENLNKIEQGIVGAHQGLEEEVTARENAMAKLSEDEAAAREEFEGKVADGIGEIAGEVSNVKKDLSSLGLVIENNMLCVEMEG